jgi:hypothetical protein
VASEHLERETKFDAAADVVLPPMDGLVDGEGRVERSGVRLDSVYFDTEDHDLLARGITLRCRTGDTDNGWQLKVPTGDARTEIRLDPTGTQSHRPEGAGHPGHRDAAGKGVAAHRHRPHRPHRTPPPQRQR